MKNSYNIISLKLKFIFQKKAILKFIACDSIKYFVLLFLSFLSSQTIVAQAVTTSLTSNTLFTIPEGVTSLKVECWGAGGKGASIANEINVGGGGGGGAYASSLLCVVPGQSYSVVIGAGGSGAVKNGGDTYFGSASLVMAKGGFGVEDNIINGVSGGLATASVGNLKYSGGNGSGRTAYYILVALAYRSGAGGGGAGSSGAGNNAVAVSAGALKADNGGKGGDGIDGELLSLLGGFAGNSGSNYGAGGGGAGRGLLFSQATYEGGNGAPGLVRITYDQYACQATMETTWNGTTWTNGEPKSCKKAIINADYNTTVNGSFESCSCQIMHGKKLTIGNGTNSDYVNIYNQLENNGTLVINNNSSLLQHYSVKNNTGNISMHRHTKPMYRHDFTYWSSPLTYDSNFTLYNLSPQTYPDKYFSWNSISQSWNVIPNGSEVMYPGKGYIVRAPQTFSTNPSETISYTGAVFSGKPNNGDISNNIVGNMATDPLLQKWNLLGNPYPSEVDIEKFLLLNNTKLDGTIYLWTHNSPASGGTYSVADYAVYNFTGPVGTGFGINAPTKYLASGQSFFVRGISDGSSSITFNNKMRTSGFNSQFYRQNVSEVNENSRLWLNLTNEEGAFNQALVGYVANATNDFD